MEGTWRQVVLSVSVCPRGTLMSCSPSSSRTPSLSSSAIESVESLCPGNRRCNQHGLALALNKRRRNGRPFHFACAGRKVACDHRNLGTDENFPLQSIGHHSSSIRRFCFDGAAMLAQPAASDKRVSTVLSRSLATASASEFR